MIRLLQAGLQTTIQDVGRNGYQSFGISKSGAMCTTSARLANIIVGNRENEPVLEILQSPHQFLFEENCTICFVGGGLQPEANGKMLELNKAIHITKGTILILKQPMPGFRMYMAIKGGIQVDDFLNSASTYLPASMGGINGRALKKGDVLIAKKTTEIKKFKNELLHYFKKEFSKSIKVIAGPEYEILSSIAKTQLLSMPFTLTNHCSRMAYRLDGNALDVDNYTEMISTTVQKGTIQLLPNGKLIILMSDCQTVGGYPRIAQIANVDFYNCAQLKPTDKILFELISLQRAEDLYLEQEDLFQQLANE